MTDAKKLIESGKARCNLCLYWTKQSNSDMGTCRFPPPLPVGGGMGRLFPTTHGMQDFCSQIHPRQSAKQ